MNLYRKLVYASPVLLYMKADIVITAPFDPVCIECLASTGIEVKPYLLIQPRKPPPTH